MVIKKIKKYNIFIVGGAGFIGSNVANFFSNLKNVKKLLYMIIFLLVENGF